MLLWLLARNKSLGDETVAKLRSASARGADGQPLARARAAVVFDASIVTLSVRPLDILKSFAAPAVSTGFFFAAAVGEDAARASFELAYA